MRLASHPTHHTVTPCVATANYQDYYVFDWTKQPFIRGAYTSPSIGSSVIHRQLLGQVRLESVIYSNPRQSVHGYLFFAGEATSVYAPSTVVGAMESAAAAVDELISTANFDDHVASALTRARIEATEEDASHEEEVEAQRYVPFAGDRYLILAAPLAGPITAEAVIRSAKL